MIRANGWLAAAGSMLFAGLSPAGDAAWSAVDHAMGRNGVDLPGGVHKFSLPRSDLRVTVDGIAIKPAFALGGWVAFLPTPSGAMVMGDLVLTDAEVNPVMAQLLAHGIDITAIHHHLLRTSQSVSYMHVGGHGDPVQLARGLRAALDSSGTSAAVPAPTSPPAPLDLDMLALDKIMGRKGTVNGGVYQYSVPRADAISESGMILPPAMGTAIALNFEPTDHGKAAVTGDFVLLASEVAPVMKSLRQHGLEVTALHNHMTADSPHLFFMHFWAHDDAAALARGLKQALDLIHVQNAG